MKRVLVVPWSMAPTMSGMAVVSLLLQTPTLAPCGALVTGGSRNQAAGRTFSNENN
jgi:hypothetical protein